MYTKGQVQKFAVGQQKISPEAHFAPFEVSDMLPRYHLFAEVFRQSTASEAQKDLVALLSAGLIGLHKEVSVMYPFRRLAQAYRVSSPTKVRLPVEDPNAFLDMVLQWSCHETANDLQRESVWHLLAALVNKREEGQFTEYYPPSCILVLDSLL